MKRAFRRREQKSTYQVWIMSYLFIMLIPLVFGVSIYMYAMGMVRNQANMAQQETLRTIVDQTDQTLNGIQESVSAVLNTSMVRSLGRETEEYDIYDFEVMATIQESMNKVKTNSSYIEEIYLYFPKQDYMLTSYNYINQDQSMFLAQSGIRRWEFSKLTMEPSYKSLRIFTSYSGPNLYLINSALNSSSITSTPEAVMLVRLNTTALKALMRPEYSTTMLVDNQGQSISTGSNEVSDELAEIIEAGEAGFWEIEDSYVRTVPSRDFDLLYVNELPQAQYFQGLSLMGLLLCIYLIVCLAGGGALAVMMARKQYHPVQEILTTIQKANLTPEEQGDMERIKKSIDRLLSEKDNFKQRLESQKLAMRSHVMYNLIKGRHLDRYVLEGIPYAKGGFQYEGGFLMGFDVEDASRAFFEEHEDLDDDLLDLVFYVVENIAEELLAEKYSAFISEADGVLLCLVDVPGQEVCQTEEDLQVIAEQIVQFLEEKFAVKLSAGISAYHENWAGIADCYHDIQDIMDYRSVNGVGELVIQFSKLETTWHEVEGGKATCEETVASESTGSPAGEPCLEDTVPERTDVRSETRISSVEIVEQVDQYIRENYRDKDLSVGKIADEFGISLSYLSQIFKRAMKIGLLEYIHLQRIEEAKKLLLEGMSVQAVAEVVGYYNTRPLIRMFKRMENMTPTEYKESKKEE